eukprot:623032-Rhodomonas_salina.1
MDWPVVKFLPAIEFAFNSTVTIHSATGVSPFWVSTGSHPTVPHNMITGAIPAANDFVASYAT